MLDKLFGSRLRATIIARLFSRTGERVFVRQLSALLNEDSTNVSRELARLERMGLLVSTIEGRQKYYRANPACPVFAELKGLAIKTAGLADVLRDALAPFARSILVAFIYGSLATGTETPESDADVLIVGRVALRSLAPALRRASSVLQREVNPMVLSQSEFADKIRRRDHFVTAVLQSPKIFLIGDESDLDRIAEQGVSGKT